MLEKLVYYIIVMLKPYKIINPINKGKGVIMLNTLTFKQLHDAKVIAKVMISEIAYDNCMDDLTGATESAEFGVNFSLVKKAHLDRIVSGVEKMLKSGFVFTNNNVLYIAGGCYCEDGEHNIIEYEATPGFSDVETALENFFNYG